MAGVEAVAGARDARAAVAAGRNGRERRGPRTGRLCELLEALLTETSIPWFRLFYMYPSGIQRDLVELMAREPRIVPYLDMPIQHGSDAVLKRMRRPERRATIRERVQWLRDAVPDLALRTTVIVGFPGETEEDFEALLDLLEEIRFDHVGAFAFSPEEGTPAAGMPDPVPDEVKRERLERLEDVQRGITLERNEAQVGRELVVLVDRAASEDGAGVAVGRSSRDAVEVDGVVLIRGAAGVRAGEFVRVRVTGADEHELTGDFIEKVR
jgi:ribosomal protein S12 methylthiotransferase